MVCPDVNDASFKHYPWMEELAAKYGTALSMEEADKVLHDEMALICAQVLADAGVYKQTEKGLRGMMAFLESLGYKEA